MNKEELVNYIKNKDRIYFILGMAFFGILILGIGGIMNGLVVDSNGGRMPVYDFGVGVGNEDTHFSFQDKSEINLFFLSDIFRMDCGNTRIMYSLGDVVITLGLIIVTSSAVSNIIFWAIFLRKDDKRFKEMEKGLS